MKARWRRVIGRLESTCLNISCVKVNARRSRGGPRKSVDVVRCVAVYSLCLQMMVSYILT